MHLEWFMGVPLSRPAVLAARFDSPLDGWPYLDEGVLRRRRARSRSRADTVPSPAVALPGILRIL